jgi:hypothetical protein
MHVQKYHEHVKVSWIMDSLVVKYVHDIIMHVQKYHEHVKVSWIMDSLVVEYVHDTTMHVQNNMSQTCQSIMDYV